MKKRLKSFAITLSSLLGTAFFAVVLTPEWADFVQYVHDTITTLGVPTVVIAVIGVFISEVWKQILNYRTKSKAIKEGLATSSTFFADRNNELY